jgi:uncharacterized membrane protein YphA (DoxX/SURF4 family)
MDERHNMMTKESVVSRVKTINLWAYRLLRAVIGGVFIYSGTIKVLDVRGFARMVSQYNLVPDHLLAPVAYGLPVVEVLAGIGLLFEIPGALTAISGMLIMFIGILWYGILKDLDIDCGCFSIEELRGQDSLKKALYRDIVMVTVCGYFYLFRIVRFRRTQVKDRWPILKTIV